MKTFYGEKAVEIFTIDSAILAVLIECSFFTGELLSNRIRLVSIVPRTLVRCNVKVSTKSTARLLLGIDTFRYYI